jgi:hypothetical protein
MPSANLASNLHCSVLQLGFSAAVQIGLIHSTIVRMLQFLQTVTAGRLCDAVGPL